MGPLYYGNGKATHQTCDLAEIPTVPHFDEDSEPLNTFVVAPKIRLIVAGMWFNLQSRLLT
jgi:hypothetical protein